MDEIQARFEDGVLRINVPKHPEKADEEEEEGEWKSINIE